MDSPRFRSLRIQHRGDFQDPPILTGHESPQSLQKLYEGFMIRFKRGKTALKSAESLNTIVNTMHAEKPNSRHEGSFLDNSFFLNYSTRYSGIMSFKRGYLVNYIRIHPKTPRKNDQFSALGFGGRL